MLNSVRSSIANIDFERWNMDIKVTNIEGVHGCEAYLLTTDKSAVVIDAGYGFCADKTVENIRAELGDRKLEHIILTHSHYDHVLGSPVISQAFPNAKIYAHPRTKQIFTKTNAKRVMEEMNQAAAKDRGNTAPSGCTENLHVDETVNEGDIIKVRDMTIRVIETPGHTNCSISLFIEEDKFLIAGETLGVALDFPQIVPTFITSYEDTIDSLRKAKSYDPEKLLLPHGYVINGSDVDIYFENAEREATNIYDIVKESYKKSCSVEEIVEQLKSIYYKGTFEKYQPEAAFYANFIPMVNKIIKKLNS